MQAERNQRNPHSTKRGPGRRHKDGTPHGRKPVEAKGAPLGFVQHTNPAKNGKRVLKKLVGARQERIDRKAAHHEALGLAS